MGWMNMEERQAAKRKFGVEADMMCDECHKPIRGLPVVDPRGGYHTKPAGTPDFLPRQPRRTFDMECDAIRRGKKPKVVAAVTVEDNKPVRDKQRVGDKATVRSTTKAVRVLAQKMLELLALNQKNKWSSRDFRNQMRPTYPRKLIREAYGYLREQRLILRKAGGIRARKGAGIP